MREHCNCKSTVHLPTQPNQTQRWETGSVPSPSLPAPPTEGRQQQNLLSARLRSPAWWLRQLWLWSCFVFCSVLSYTICNHYVYTSVIVQGKSMLPTLRDGDHYILNRWLYRYQDPERGDLVVLRDPGHTDYAVKRIVGLPGETVHLKDGKVFVDGLALPEPHLLPGQYTVPPQGREMTLVLGHNEYFVLGDNRRFSEDSRYYGAISRDQISGLLAVK